MTPVPNGASTGRIGRKDFLDGIRACDDTNLGACLLGQLVWKEPMYLWGRSW